MNSQLNLRIFTIVLLFIFLSEKMWSQIEKYPIYSGCDSVENTKLEKCFMENVSNDFYEHFKIPKDCTEEQSKFYVVFVATKEGTFEVIHVSSQSPKINREVENAFSKLPEFQPATFDDRPMDRQFILYYPPEKSNVNISSTPSITENLPKPAQDSLIIPQLETSLRIPYSYYNYHFLENTLNDNPHTIVKPYLYHVTVNQEKFSQEYTLLLKAKTSWWGRKFWNENFVEITGDDYWFHVDPIVDVQLGKDNSDINYTYNNTRAARVEGSLWNKVSFSSTIYESQGRFSEYFNRYATSIKAFSEGAGIVPGQGIAKAFGENGFDYPVATGYVSYSPNKTFNFQFGRDKNFIGEGYRSLFLSDNATAPTFFKIQTNFWKIQYTNLWLWLRDVREDVTVDGVFKRKFIAIHHLSWNATKRLNIGFFESVIWAKTDNQGFDVDYLNPIIFYRPIEFAAGTNRGNAMIGTNAKYQFTDKISIYSQLLFDEITIKELFGSNAYWGNKYAFQLGGKYSNAFGISHLNLQAEYNMVRPYTYSHDNPETNYGTYNQSLAHPWGSNFREGVFIADYKKNRWFGMTKIVAGIKGFDYNSDTDTYSYGGDIYRDYSERNATYGIKTGQGNKASIFVGEFQAGYLINPATNLKLFGSLLYRKFEAPVENDVFKNGTTTWISFGLRSDLSNWYFDF